MFYLLSVQWGRLDQHSQNSMQWKHDHLYSRTWKDRGSLLLFCIRGPCMKSVSYEYMLMLINNLISIVYDTCCRNTNSLVYKWSLLFISLVYTNPKYHNNVCFLYQTKIANWKLVTVHSAQPSDEPVQCVFMWVIGWWDGMLSDNWWDGILSGKNTENLAVVMCNLDGMGCCLVIIQIVW